MRSPRRNGSRARTLGTALLWVGIGLGLAGTAAARPGGPIENSFVVLVGGCGIGDIGQAPCRVQAAPGEVVEFQVIAWGAGSISSTFLGTVTFTSGDTNATLPPPYRFTSSDAGVHTFRAIFQTHGRQALVAATDPSVSWGYGTALFDVVRLPPLLRLAWTSIPAGPPEGEITHVVEAYDHTIWYTWTTGTGSGIGHVDDSGTVLPATSRCVTPRSVARDFDGTIWYLCAGAGGAPGGIGHVTRLEDRFVPFPPGVDPQDLAIGYDGTVYFSDDADRIGKLNTFGIIGFISLPPSAVRRRPARMVQSDGWIYFAERNGGVGRLTPQGDIREFAIPSGAHADEMTGGPFGVVTFTEPGAPRYGQILFTGVAEHDLPGGEPALAVADADPPEGVNRGVWVTTSGGTLQSLNLGGSYSVPYPTLGRRLAFTPGGDFLLAGGGRIARVRISEDASSAPMVLDGRFTAEIEWKTAEPAANRGAGMGVALTENAGYFWFFSANNVEILVKLVDGRAVNGHYWLFAGSLTDVEFTLTVTDTWNGARAKYTKPAGQLASIADVAAF